MIFHRQYSVSDLEAALVTADQAGDGGKVSFLRTQLEQLYKDKVALREEKNLLLQAQQGGGIALCCHHLLTLATSL